MKAEEQKPSGGRPRVFITITRSFLTRNILRSGVLEGLVKHGFAVDVFFSSNEIPQYIREEFESESVTLHAFTLPPPRGVHRRINFLKRFFIDTPMTRTTLKYWTKRDSGGYAEATGMLYAFQRALMSVMSNASLLKILFRHCELWIFRERHQQVVQVFDALRPVAVFSTSIISSFDIIFLKEASRRRIPTISQPKGWDNITKEFYPVLPEVFLVPSETAKSATVRLQGMDAGHVIVVGLPQFDWYAREDAVRTREEHFASKGLDPNKALIFFGSEGSWVNNETVLVSKIIKWIRNDELTRPAQLFIRPHFSNVTKDVFAEFRGMPGVFVDSYRIVDFLLEKWDPSVAETIDFVNSIRHSDIIINIASTLSLDGAALDRPIIEIAFGCEHIGDKDVTEEKLYSTDHMQWLHKLDGTIKVRSYDELKQAINDYLSQPTLKAEGRKRVREELTYAIDGKSSERIVEAIQVATKKHG